MPKLTTQDTFEIKELVKEKRGQFQIGMGPIGENIFKIVKQLGIKLVFFPIQDEGSNNNEFSALYLLSKENDKDVAFIGINTYQNFDRQIFSVAHELYHHWTDTTLSVCHLSDENSELVELKANRFAAEFLLPSETLLTEVGLKNEGRKNLYNFTDKGLLRFISLLHCDYKLPFRAVVRRLYEDSVINSTQYELLTEENGRDENSAYYKIAINQDSVTFVKLNEQTCIQGTDGENLDLMLNLFENDTVTIEELANDLTIFNKSLADFDLEEEIEQGDIDELQDFLKEFEDES